VNLQLDHFPMIKKKQNPKTLLREILLSWETKIILQTFCRLILIVIYYDKN